MHSGITVVNFDCDTLYALFSSREGGSWLLYHLDCCIRFFMIYVRRRRRLHLFPHETPKRVQTPV